LIRRDYHLEMAESERRNEAARAEVATIVTDAVQAVLNDCTAAVAAVDYGAEWRLLAQRGPVDVAASWRQLVAWHDRDGDPSSPPLDSLVLKIPVTGMRAMLVVVPVPGTARPGRAEEIVRPLVEAGAILFGAAGSAAPNEPLLRLVGEPHRSRTTR
jgi:hypothetical protein